MNKKRTKAFPVDFKNSEGKVVRLSSKLTLNDLAVMGIRIEMEPNEKPKDSNPRNFYHEPK